MHGFAARHRAPAAVLLAASALLACAGAGSSPAPDPTDDPAATVAIAIAHTSAGVALAGPNGKTLYIRTEDRDGSSSCTMGPCARAWGALVGEGSRLQIAAGVAGRFGITIWPDGTQQVTHNGQPLYYYSQDEAAGDARGQGSGGGAWCIASVSANPGCEGLTPAGPSPAGTFVIPGPGQRAADSAEDY
jgi:predicted lipoprotein with Yx(FWY)xxD motif